MIRTYQLGLQAGSRTLLENLDWRIGEGECWSIIGRNGAGKSTLLRTLAGLRDPDAGHVTLQGRALVDWPLAALAGWLTIAAPLNLITTATAFDALPAFLSPTGWAIAAIVVVVLIGAAVTASLRTLAYPLPIAWGLVGAFVAEQERNPVLGFTALGAAFLLVVAAVILVFGLKRGIERRR